NVPAGTYTVTVTDENGCTGTISATIEQPVLPLDITGSVTNVLCYGESTGAIDITITGGTSPYLFNWSNLASSEDLTGLTANTYTVTVTDFNGCTLVAGFMVTQPSEALSLDANIIHIICHGGNNGAIDLSVSGGVAPYNYVWSNGAVLQDLNSLDAGDYTVTVTDANGCTAIETYAVTEADVLAVTETHNNPTCFGGNNGAIDITVTGGATPYTFLWSNSETT